MKPRERDVQGWTMVNDAGAEAGRAPYLNYCRECGWAGAIALWFGDATGQHCPICKGADIGRLIPEAA